MRMSHTLQHSVRGCVHCSGNVNKLWQYPKSYSKLHTRANSSKGDRNAVSSGDLRLDLWRALLLAGSSQVLAAMEASTTAVTTGAVKLVTLLEPLPAGFPPGPATDQAVALISSPLETISAISQEYGGLAGLRLGGERVVLVSEPGAARQVLIDQSDVFIKEGTAFFPGSSLAGNGLLVSDGEIWKRQRRLSNPAFRKSAVDAYAGAMIAVTADMLEKMWREGEVREVYSDFNELTLGITMEALFGFSGTTGPQAREITAAVERAFDYFTQRGGSGMMLPEWLPTWDNLEFGAAVARLNKVVYGLIAQRRQEQADGSAPSRPNLLSALLAARDGDGSAMDDVSVRDELMTLLVAGQETSAILLGWTVALLAAHPDVQQKGAAEVLAVLQGRTPTAADFGKLPYIESIVLESLRLYSPAYLVGRCACQDATVGPYQLPAGTTVLVSPYLLHRDPKYWPNADVFRPERWQEMRLEGGYISALRDLGPNGAYIPFGGGPRNCIGTGFAMMEAVLVLAAVLQRYDLQLPPGGGMPKPRPLITLRPERVDVVLGGRRGGGRAGVLTDSTGTGTTQGAGDGRGSDGAVGGVDSRSGAGNGSSDRGNTTTAAAVSAAAAAAAAAAATQVHR